MLKQEYNDRLLKSIIKAYKKSDKNIVNSIKKVAKKTINSLKHEKKNKPPTKQTNHKVDSKNKSKN